MSEFRRFVIPLKAFVFSVAAFGINEQAEAFIKREVVDFGHSVLFFESFEHAGEPKRSHDFKGLFSQHYSSPLFL
jgi:hypothetical protein